MDRQGQGAYIPQEILLLVEMYFFNLDSQK